MEELEKIDLIRERLGVSYEKAYSTLQETNGDVVEALIKLEKEKGITQDENIDVERLQVKGQEIINKLREIVKEGNVNKIVVKNNEKTLVEIPVTAGIIGGVLFPYLTMVAGMAAMYKEYTLEIAREKNNKNADEENKNDDMGNNSEFN
ncbi:MAG TPA: DUF4342 domain-containing protein [Halanaerobiales bacterium]|nr:DUF4342 domain-containing protein [Halanaerobiales bacterium]